MLRGAARYYLAAGLARAVIESWRFSIEPGDTDPMRQGALAAAGRRTVAAARAAARQRALDAATGLSAGVEDEEEEFVEYGPGGPTVRTFAEAESELIRRIRHAAAGGTRPEMTGTRLDGVEESLSAYRGRVVLLDFWATWCAPCVDDSIPLACPNIGPRMSKAAVKPPDVITLPPGGRRERRASNPWTERPWRPHRKRETRRASGPLRDFPCAPS